MLLLRVTTILAVVFLLADTPSQRLFFSENTPGTGDAVLFGAAWADTGNEADAVLVECLLPGKIRPLGSTTYITREKTIKTTQKDCEARGGKTLNSQGPEAEIPGGDSIRQNDHSPK